MENHLYGIIIKPPQPNEISTTIQITRVDRDLSTLQRAVGGYIEIVDCFPTSDVVFVINEEGKLKNLRINPLATKMYADSDSCLFSDVTGDIIVGNALTMRRFGDELVGFSELEARFFCQYICDEAVNRRIPVVVETMDDVGQFIPTQTTEEHE